MGLLQGVSPEISNWLVPSEIFLFNWSRLETNGGCDDRPLDSTSVLSLQFL